MAVREDRPPPLRLGGRHRLAIARLAVLWIGAIKMACDVR